MEKNEKTQKPAWVNHVEKSFSPLVQPLVGNLCGNAIQAFLHVAGLDLALAQSVLDEMSKLLEDERIRVTSPLFEND